jgi:Fe2+ transport system protein FeoA
MRRIPNEENCERCPVFPEKECLGKSVIPLSQFKPGEKGIVFQACGDPEVRLRLMEMGFIRGTEVKVVKRAPLNDPFEFVIRGYHVSLRKEEAEHILMEEASRAA